MLGHHELLIRLASGGAANVFLVRDSQTPDGRLLALKILLPSLAANEDFLNMFFTEARIAAQLEHPNIVAIAGFGQVEGIHCLAMEYVFGASLAQVLKASARAKKPLTVGVLLRITAQVCDALHYAHELMDGNGRSMGIVHRDVTPQNILIGFNGVPKLTDFGIAKATNRGWETQAGIVKGKFSYMSPEQALGKKVDRRSDIFGAGIVLWEALTGRDLFKGGSPLEVLTAIREQKIDPPSQVVPGLTPIVDPIVMKALRRSPRSRFQTALEMKQEIEELIERAGVTIDAATISREFAAIYGDEIVNRAFALRAAMAGKADVDHLSQVLGGSKLNPKFLPVIPGGITNPDPLGLFSEAPGAAREEREERVNGPAVPARIDKPFTLASVPAQKPDAIDELEIVEGEEAAVELAEVARLEPEVPKVRLPDAARVPAERPPTGWDDSTAMSVPSDELLSMISEDDATIGYLPAAFAERFGRDLKRALAEGESEAEHTNRFEDELTVGMASAPDLGRLRPVNPFEAHSPWPDFEEQPIPRRPDGPAPHGPTELAGKNRSLRPIPRAPSLDMETRGRYASATRPIPRAPSLDMEVENTPRPEMEETAGADARPSRPAPPPPPPPPPRGASRPIFVVEEPLLEAELELPAANILDPLAPPAAGEQEPASMPGSAVLLDGLPGGDLMTPGSPLGMEELVEVPELALHGRGELGANGAALFEEPSVDPGLPPLSPDALRALAASAPAAQAAPVTAGAELPGASPSVSLELEPPPRRGVHLTVGLLALVAVGLIALGVVIGILLTGKNG